MQDMLRQKRSWLPPGTNADQLARGRLERPLVANLKWIIAAGSIVAIAGVVLLAYIISRPSAPPSQPQVVTPIYESASTWLDIITAQEKAGHWDVASSNAEMVLKKPNLHPNDRQILAQKAVEDGVKAITFKKVAPNDTTAQTQAVNRYQDLKKMALDLGVYFPSPRQVSGEAFNSERYLLAKVSFEDSVKVKDVSVADQEQMRFYYAILYSLGWHWTQDKTGANYQDGLRMLVAAHNIDRQYQLDIGLAQARLKGFIGLEDGNWPSSSDTPLLTITDN